MGDFRKKNSCRLISREKILARKYLAKKTPALKKNIFHGVRGCKKFLHRCMSGKNYITRGLGKIEILPKLTHPYPAIPQKSNGRPLS